MTLRTSADRAIQGVLFDFHNTLVHLAPTAKWIASVGGQDLAPARRELLADVLSTVWARADARWPGSPWDLTPAAHRQAFTVILQEDGGCSQSTADRFYDVMPNQWLLAPGAGRLLTDLRRSGMKLGVISNIGIDIRPTLEVFGILELLDAVVLSFEVGMVKPDPNIFRHAAHALGLRPAQCLMVGDTPAADGAASRTGMTALVVPMDVNGPRLELVAVLCRSDG